MPSSLCILFRSYCITSQRTGLITIDPNHNMVRPGPLSHVNLVFLIPLCTVTFTSYSTVLMQYNTLANEHLGRATPPRPRLSYSRPRSTRIPRSAKSALLHVWCDPVLSFAQLGFGALIFFRLLDFIHIVENSFAHFFALVLLFCDFSFGCNLLQRLGLLIPNICTFRRIRRVRPFALL